MFGIWGAETAYVEVENSVRDLPLMYMWARG